MTSRRESTQVSTDFRQDDLGGATSYAGNRLQLCNGGFIWLGVVKLSADRR
jgi:hypothetical protein